MYIVCQRSASKQICLAAFEPISTIGRLGKCTTSKDLIAMTHTLAGQWPVECSRGPDWLFVRLAATTTSQSSGYAGLADSLDQLLRAELLRRLLVELDQVEDLTEELVAELESLRCRLETSGGLLRISGVGDASLPTNDRQHHLAHYPTRRAAVTAGRPATSPARDC